MDTVHTHGVLMRRRESKAALAVVALVCALLAQSLGAPPVHAQSRATATATATASATIVSPVGITVISNGDTIRRMLSVDAKTAHFWIGVSSAPVAVEAAIPGFGPDAAAPLALIISTSENNFVIDVSVARDTVIVSANGVRAHIQMRDVTSNGGSDSTALQRPGVPAGRQAGRQFGVGTTLAELQQFRPRAWQNTIAVTINLN